MDLGILNVDFNAIINSVWNALFRIVKIPFSFINNLSWQIKLGLFIFAMMIMIIVALLVWKYRYEWRSVQRI